LAKSSRTSSQTRSSSHQSGGRIEVHLERARSYARIQVIDSGTGISAELLPHVFDRFRQANRPSAHTYDGLGIGLAIVKSLVEFHGGRVRPESAGEGKGATLTVELPLAPKAPAAAVGPRASGTQPDESGTIAG